MAKITIYVPDQDPISLILDGEPQVTVGRAPEMNIIVEHASISSSHAQFKLVGENYHLEDLGSTNGTFVEGEAITEVQLVNGSRITFGTVEAEFEADEAAEEAPATEEVEDPGDSNAGYVATEASVAETSVRPAGFRDLSPIEKVVKKDNLKTAAIAIGTIAILAAIGLIVLSAMMTAA